MIYILGYIGKKGLSVKINDIANQPKEETDDRAMEELIDRLESYCMTTMGRVIAETKMTELTSAKEANQNISDELQAIVGNTIRFCEKINMDISGQMIKRCAMLQDKQNKIK